MAKIFSLAMLLLVSGCAALLNLTDSEMAGEGQGGTAIAKSATADTIACPGAEKGKGNGGIPSRIAGEGEGGTAIGKSATADTIVCPGAEKGKGRGDIPSRRETMTSDEVRQVQRLLKTAGFYPGKIDGTLGPRTKSALRRLRTGCSALADLLDEGAVEKIVPGSNDPGARGSNAAPVKPSKEEIQIIQVRLKDAGFDPGTIDGISGPKTQAALARFQSACGDLGSVPPAAFEVARSTKEGGPRSGANIEAVQVSEKTRGDGGASLQPKPTHGSGSDPSSTASITETQTRY